MKHTVKFRWADDLEHDTVVGTYDTDTPEQVILVAAADLEEKPWLIRRDKGGSGSLFVDIKKIAMN